jgi:hypothetical protein
MKFSAPKQITWWIAVVVGVLGILSAFVAIPVISSYAIWFVFVGFALLALGTLLPNL